MPHRLPLFPRPASTIGLLGGSFNPAHSGHLYVSEQVKKRLNLSEIWWCVSPQNPLKPTEGMAPLQERVLHAEALTQQHPFIRVSTIEAERHTHYTVDLIAYLTRAYPHTRFVWIMGADNWANFHQWKGWRKIAEHLPLVVVERGSYHFPALKGRAARVLANYRVELNDLMDVPCPAWSYLPILPHPASATAIREEESKALMLRMTGF